MSPLVPQAIPCRADRLLGVGPGELRVALGVVRTRLQALFDVFEARVRILLVRLVRIAVGGVEVLPAVTLVVVRLARVLLVPVGAEAFDAVLAVHGPSPM